MDSHLLLSACLSGVMMVAAKNGGNFSAMLLQWAISVSVPFKNVKTRQGSIHSRTTRVLYLWCHCCLPRPVFSVLLLFQVELASVSPEHAPAQASMITLGNSTRSYNNCIDACMHSDHASTYQRMSIMNMYRATIPKHE